MVSLSITIWRGQRTAFQSRKDAKPSPALSARPPSAGRARLRLLSCADAAEFCLPRDEEWSWDGEPVLLGPRQRGMQDSPHCLVPNGSQTRSSYRGQQLPFLKLSQTARGSRALFKQGRRILWEGTCLQQYLLAAGGGRASPSVSLPADGDEGAFEHDPPDLFWVPCEAEAICTLGTTDRPPGNHTGKARTRAATETTAWSWVTPASSLPQAGNKTGAARPTIRAGTIQSRSNPESAERSNQKAPSQTNV